MSVRTTSEIPVYGLRVSFRDSLRRPEFSNLVFSAFVFFLSSLIFFNFENLIFFIGYGRLLVLYPEFQSILDAFVSINLGFFGIVIAFLTLFTANLFAYRLIRYLQFFRRPLVVDCRQMNACSSQLDEYLVTDSPFISITRLDSDLLQTGYVGTLCIGAFHRETGQRFHLDLHLKHTELSVLRQKVDAVDSYLEENGIYSLR